MEKKESMKKCYRCKVPLELMDTHFTYLGKKFKHPVPRCPKCGQVFIDKELAKGKMHQVESSFEEK